MGSPRTATQTFDRLPQLPKWSSGPPADMGWVVSGVTALICMYVRALLLRAWGGLRFRGFGSRHVHVEVRISGNPSWWPFGFRALG